MQVSFKDLPISCLTIILGVLLAMLVLALIIIFSLKRKHYLKVVKEASFSISEEKISQPNAEHIKMPDKKDMAEFLSSNTTASNNSPVQEKTKELKIEKDLSDSESKA